MNQFDFAGRCAVVTGGVQGIGAAIAKRLQTSGAKVAIWDLDGKPRVDVADQASIDAAVKRTIAELGSIDVLINSVTPAAAQTAILEQVTPEFAKYMLSKIPMGRFVKVEEIAALVCWLASEECSFSTGAVFDISGGRATY